METNKGKTNFFVILKNARQSRNISGATMAKMLGLKQQTYNRYELNTCEPPLVVVVRIAQLLNVSTDFLLGISENPRPNSVQQTTVNGHNINGNSNVVSGADAARISKLEQEIAELKIKLDYATELLSQRK